MTICCYKCRVCVRTSAYFCCLPSSWNVCGFCISIAAPKWFIHSLVLNRIPLKIQWIINIMYNVQLETRWNNNHEQKNTEECERRKQNHRTAHFVWLMYIHQTVCRSPENTLTHTQSLFAGANLKSFWLIYQSIEVHLLLRAIVVSFTLGSICFPLVGLSCVSFEPTITIQCKQITIPADIRIYSDQQQKKKQK